jgi:hypothetical protein
VQTKQVVVTPNASSHVNLEEMNNILRKMKLGESAVREMAELDSNRGMTGKARRRDDYGREIGAPTDMVRAGSSAVAGSDAALALDDAAIANNLRSQAERMATDAKQLLAESNRLMQEAAGMTQPAAPVAKATRGRAKKAATNAVN